MRELAHRGDEAHRAKESHRYRQASELSSMPEWGLAEQRHPLSQGLGGRGE